MKLSVKKGSSVKIIAGSDRGKTGTVLEVNAVKMRVKVQGVRIITKLDKRENQLIKTEGFVHYSNVELLDSPKKAPAKKKSTKSAPKKTARA